jgi:hypothetical protein
MVDRLSEQFSAIERAASLRAERIEAYKALYTENDAQRLADAYELYPWVNPQILVSTVLSGNDSVLPQIAEYAAIKMAEAGATPVEMSRKADLLQKFNDRLMYETYKEDPTGDANMQMIAKGSIR